MTFIDAMVEQTIAPPGTIAFGRRSQRPTIKLTVRPIVFTVNCRPLFRLSVDGGNHSSS